MSKIAYIIGSLIILAALVWAARLLGVPDAWLGVGILLGLGIVVVRAARSHTLLR